MAGVVIEPQPPAARRRHGAAIRSNGAEQQRLRLLEGAERRTPGSEVVSVFERHHRELLGRELDERRDRKKIVAAYRAALKAGDDDAMRAIARPPFEEDKE